MANKNLGLVGDAGDVLPGTITIPIPIELVKQAEKAKMSDGSFRWAFFQEYRRWTLNWTKLTAAELVDLTDLVALNQILKWQNNDESATLYDVVITAFSYDSVDPISATKLYKATMTLDEAI